MSKRLSRVSLETLEPRQLFTAGQIDTSFGGGDGIASIDFDGRRLDNIAALVVQPDGKIVIVGSTNSTDESGNLGTDFAIARLNPDVTPDRTFADDGVFDFPFFGNLDRALNVLLQPDGKIVAGGTLENDPNQPQTVNSDAQLGVVVRLNPDGSLDSGFGSFSTGVVLIDVSRDPITGLANNAVRTIALQSSGKIVFGGAANVERATAGDFLIGRLTSVGDLDTTFGTEGTGLIITDVSEFNQDGVTFQGEVSAIAIDPQQRIVATGPLTNTDAARGVFLVSRLLPDGTDDLSFGDGGANFVPLPAGQLEVFLPYATSLLLQPDGKIITGGYLGRFDFNTFSLTVSFVLARFDGNGQLDPTFSGDGVVETFFGPQENPNALAALTQLLPQPGGRILAVGNAALLDGSFDIDALAAARYNPDGSLDQTFGTRGQLLVRSGGGFVTAAGNQLTDRFGAFTTASAALAANVPGGGTVFFQEAANQLAAVRTGSDGADLVLALQNVRAGSFLTGSKATATVRISNRGTTAFNGTVPVSFSISTDGAVSADDRPMTTVPMRLTLKIGAFRNVPVRFTYPAGDYTGQFFVLADAQSNAQLEGNIFNNTAPSPVTVVLNPAFVDVSVSLVSSPSTIAAGRRGVFALRVTNAGSVPVSGSVLFQILASIDGAESGDDLALLPGRAQRTFIRAGSSVVLRFTATLPKTATKADFSNLILKVNSGALVGARNPNKTVIVAAPFSIT